MNKRISYSLAIGLVAVLVSSALSPHSYPPRLLSSYHFFAGDLKDQMPGSGVVPYQLSTPLFSDYAEKLRFVQVPDGKSVAYNDSSVFDFPVGTVLIKTFFFPNDFRNPARGRKLMETRLLIREETQWTALPYIWKEDQSDAVLDLAGESRVVKYVDRAGKKKEHRYLIPNQNECKGCHNYNETMVPIGPTTRQLNHEMDYADGRLNQLVYWSSKNILHGFNPAKAKTSGIVWSEPASASLNERARLWLDVNCGFCHQPQGPAGASGLYLHFGETDPLRLGIEKTPVAAGRGSGNRRFDIVPGKPDESILIYRMESDDPGIMMPELGRSVKHQEGISLIRKWIMEMKTHE